MVAGQKYNTVVNIILGQFRTTVYNDISRRFLVFRFIRAATTARGGCKFVRIGRHSERRRGRARRAGRGDKVTIIRS